MTGVRTLLGGLVAGLATAALLYSGALDGVELATLDRLFLLRGPQTPSLPIVIVTIDEDSFDDLGLAWPFPRALHGRLLDRLSEGHPLAIGVDLIFSEPSSRGAADDEALAAAVARAGNVVLGAAPNKRYDLGEQEDANLPIFSLRTGAAAVAPVNLDTDDDGRVRRAPMRVKAGDQVLLGFDAQLHALIARAGRPLAPLPATAEILINFRGPPRTYPWVPYYRVLNGEIPADEFRGRIVLIGPTSEVLHDIFPAPFAHRGDMPGVEIHANALETLALGIPIRPVPPLVSVVAAALAGLAGAWLVVRLRALRGFLVAVLVWVALAAVTIYAFTTGQVWLRAAGISVALGLGYGCAVIASFVREQRERRRLSQFFSPSVVREVVRHREGARLSSSRRMVTVLFSDIRGFTSISERLEPEQVAEMLREYLSEMTEIVFKHGGTVDKYIGDCVMALYNVPFADPDHAVHAVRTALEFQERTLAVSARWQERLGVSLRSGVGINTGEAIVGAMGSRQRLEYTAIGDTVNLASRLETATKDYAASIIISEDTRSHLRGDFLIRELGDVTVKGKSRPVTIYAVLPADTRTYPRAALEVEAVITRADGQAFAVGTHDVGEGGVALSGVPDELARGETVEIRCEGGLLGKPLVARGTIAWRHGDRAGVTFTFVDADSAHALTEYIAARRAAPPP